MSFERLCGMYIWGAFGGVGEKLVSEKTSMNTKKVLTLLWFGWVSWGLGEWLFRAANNLYLLFG